MHLFPCYHFYHESIWKHVYRRGYRRYDITGTSVWRDYPKTIATLKADDLALTYARPIYALMTVLTPVIYIVGKLANGILFLLRVDPNAKKDTITEHELRSMVNVGQKRCY